jgi:hypothetical protein
MLLTLFNPLGRASWPCRAQCLSTFHIPLGLRCAHVRLPALCLPTFEAALLCIHPPCLQNCCCVCSSSRPCPPQLSLYLVNDFVHTANRYDGAVDGRLYFWGGQSNPSSPSVWAVCWTPFSSAQHVALLCPFDIRALCWLLFSALHLVAKLCRRRVQFLEDVATRTSSLATWSMER